MPGSSSAGSTPAVAVPPAGAVPRHALRLLGAAVAVIGAGQAIQVAIVPGLIAATGIDAATLGLLVALGVLPFMVGAPLWGRLSDRFGRRPVLLAGLVGAALAHALFAGAADLLAAGRISHGTGLGVMIVSRLIFGVAGSAIYPVGQAWAVDLAGPERRLAAAGALAAGLSVGRLAGPAVALALLMVGPVAPLWGLSAIGAASAVLVMVGLGGAAAAAGRGGAAVAAGRPPRAAEGMMRPFLVVGIGTFAMGMMQFVFGLHAMARLDMAAPAASQLVAIVMAAAAVVMLGIQTLVLPRIGTRPALAARAWAAGLVLLPLSIALGWWGGAWWAFVASAMLTGAGMAVVVAMLFARVTADPRLRGTRAGLLNSAQTAGYAAGSAVGGLYAVGAALPFGLALAALLVAVVAGWRLPARPV